MEVAFEDGFPSLGFLNKAVRADAFHGWSGREALTPGVTLVIESITDNDWAGCKRSRRSKSALQIFVGW